MSLVRLSTLLRTSAVLTLLLLITSCSSDPKQEGPIGPAARDTNTVVVFVGGSNDAPISDVTVKIADSTYTTGASGFVTHESMSGAGIPQTLPIVVSREGWSFTPSTATVDVVDGSVDTVRIFGEDTNSPLYIEMVDVPPGTFQVGTDSAYAIEVDMPAYEATLTKGFQIGQFEVTERLWQAVMGDTPNLSGCSDCPVLKLTFSEALDFCNKLSVAKGLEPVYVVNGSVFEWNQNANGYRLPTECEWEWAVRGDLTTAWYYGFYPDYDKLHEQAWNRNGTAKEVQPVGQLRPNERGLYDMLGNAAEYVWDWYQRGHIPGPKTDYTGPATGDLKIQKGGGYSMGQGGMRMSTRVPVELEASNTTAYLNAGLRVVLNK